LNIDEKPKVVIVSAFGRGNWLAAEVKNSGFDVCLVDVTDSLGRWAPEDWEGPFGYFQPETLTQSQRVRLDEEDYSEAVEDGLTIWLRNGPIDMRGPHSGYLLEQNEVPTEVQNYLQLYRTWPEKKQAEKNKELQSRPFYETWLACLAHAFASPEYLESHKALLAGEPLPLFAQLQVRRVSRKGFEKSLEWVKSRGVEVHTKAKIKDISIGEGALLNIEVAGEWSGVVSGHQFVWALTSLESARLGEKFHQQLYNGTSLAPEWVWLRYRAELAIETNGVDVSGLEALPLKWLMIEDLALPWTHENFLAVQKTTTKDSLDVWLRAPAGLRFQKNYIEDLGRKVCDLFTARLPYAKCKVLEYPQEYHYDEATLGPSRFYCIGENTRGKLKTVKVKNIHFDGPEQVLSLDWNGQFTQQTKIHEDLVNWKTDRDRKIEKLKAKEAQA